jgi:hypothetical protein
VSRAPRIDTTRNRVNGTLALLRIVLEELEDLHVLAYERARAVSEAKVSGGARDYALDTHGDQRARDAYRHLSRVMVGWRDSEGVVHEGVCDMLDDAANEVISLLRVSGEGEKGHGRIPVVEMAALLQAQARRAKAGVYTPVAFVPQPLAAEASTAMDQLLRERDQLEGRVKRLEGKLRAAGIDPEAKSKRGWRKTPRSA